MAMLGRQSLLAGHFLQFRQIGIWVAAKAGAQSARLTPLIETLTELLPLPAICAAQIGVAGWMLTGSDGRDQAPLTTQQEGGGGGLAAVGPPLVVALRAELMLEIIVGMRQI